MIRSNRQNLAILLFSEQGRVTFKGEKIGKAIWHGEFKMSDECKHLGTRKNDDVALVAIYAAFWKSI